MDLVTLSFRGENGKLDRYLGGINCFGGCSTHLSLLFTSDNMNFTSSPLKDSSQEKLDPSKLFIWYTAHSLPAPEISPGTAGVRNALIIHALWPAYPLYTLLLYSIR